MNLETLNMVDVVLGGVVIISALIGLMRGLLREILSLSAWLLAIWAGITFAETVSNQFVQQVISDKHIAYIAAFGAVFFVVLFLIGLLNLLITSLFKATGLGGFDRLLGMLFGLARGAIIGAVIVFFARLYPNIDKIPAWQQSQLMPGFSNLAGWAIARIPEHVRSYADSWLNPDSVLPSTPEVLRSNNGQLRLESLDDASTTAERPQVSAEQLRQQAVQSNSLSNSPSAEDNAGLRLESLQDQHYEGAVEEVVPEENDTEKQSPNIRLESLGNGN